MKTEGSKILIIDDEPEHARATAESLEKDGFNCLTATTGQEGLNIISSQDLDVVITDLKMPDVDGMEILKQAKKKIEETEVIIMTGYGTVESAVEAMRLGASSYLQKPINIKELRMLVAKALEKQNLKRENIALQKQLDTKYGFSGIIGSSESMMRIFETLQQVSNSSATVLITGESGTGKELVARAIHNSSPRRLNHFVPLHCAALSEGVLESELFGHEKGAFTGAFYTRKGRFEFADKGTLFLDEISDMPINTQIKLLRVIEDGQVYRLGSNEPIKVNVRIISATNRPLENLIKENKFREDLFFRLNVVSIYIPTLRERQSDIPLITNHYIKEFSKIHDKKINGISQQVNDLFYTYNWPGNVRELKNCIESMIVLTKDPILDLDDVPAYILKILPEFENAAKNLTSLSSQTPATYGSIISQATTLEDMEKELIKAKLIQYKGNRTKVAKELKIGETTLYRKIKKYRLENF